MRMRGHRVAVGLALVAGGLGIFLSLPGQPVALGAAAQPYRSPLCVAIAPNGKEAFASDVTAGNLTVLDVAGKAEPVAVPLRGQPRGVCLSKDGSRAYVAEHGAGTVAVVDTVDRKVIERIAVGHWPTAVALAPQTKRLYVGNQDRHSVSVVDLAQTPSKAIGEIKVLREPSCIAVTPDEKRLVVTNLMPLGPGTNPRLAAKVCLLDAQKLAVTKTIELTPGSTAVKGVCISGDGKWAYVVHALARFNLPITQLERGWVNTYALSILDLAAEKRFATMLLDDLTQGAANPHSIVCSKDGKRLWISHSGVHEVSMLDAGKIHELLSGKVPDELASLKDGSLANIWVRIQKDRSLITELENDLTALYIAGAIRRAKTQGNGPRGLALTPDEKQLLVANYYSGTVAVLDAANGKVTRQLALGPQPEADSVRRGEALFHDATQCFQRWHSCGSCHLNQGRIDGLRWDFLSDGIGNGKDTPNLLYFHQTAPLNRRATRTNPKHDGVYEGFTHSHMLVPPDQAVDDVFAYLKSLRPVPSPHLTPQGKLSASAQRGKTLFEGKAECSDCHPAPYYTDLKKHNIGALTPNEPDGQYDTPALLEAYRTAPYLHDGRAVTLKDVFTTCDPDGKHGEAKKLSDQELNDLIAYLLSL